MRQCDSHVPRLLFIAVLFLSAAPISSAQELEKFLGTRTELITLHGGKPTLTATGDGITSYKATDVYQRGQTNVKVSLDVLSDDATAVGNDDYVVKLKTCVRKCRVRAIAIDANGLETRSEAVEFIVASTPSARLGWFDGEYARELEARTTLKVNNELILVAAANYGTFEEAEIVKMDIFVDDKLICSDDEPMQVGYGAKCVWRPSPGRYKLYAVATDVDGMKGKSEVIEVVIERP